MTHSKALIYNFQENSSFINSDRTIIASKYNVYDFQFYSSYKVTYPFLFIWQCIFLIYHWNKFNLIISQISGFHTYIPSLLSFFKLKKHIIILHGTDCNIIPEIGYGNLQRPILKWFTKKSIQNANFLLPVSESLICNDSDYYTENQISLGLNKNITGLNTPIQVVHNGIETNSFFIKNNYREPNSFLTIALGLENEKNVKLKGIDLILGCAENNPNIKVTIVGSESVFNYNNNLKNVKVIGKINQTELLEFYNENKYYLQLSISESFGLSLCESMLCGCIPIISNTGMMPEIIEDKGYILEKRDLNIFIKLIDSILLNKKGIDPFEIRKLIVAKYTIDKRIAKLLSVIDHLTKVTSP